MMLATASAKLQAVKAVHTAAWAVFAAATFLIPVFAFLGNLRLAAILIGVVAIECLVLLANRMRCPLTPLAARYTDNRADNFDIFLPLWLARFNKQIFGTSYVLSIIYVIVLWSRSV